MPIEMIEPAQEGTRIKVVGVGGGGGNAVDHMIRNGVEGVEFVCANTDAQALNRSKASTLLPLGASGLGAGGNPAKGRSEAESSENAIRDALDGAHMVFITAGMGGGTGTGGAPIVARVAKEMGILTVGVVTKPFEFEGSRRMKQAEAGITELQANCDSLIVVLNDKLLEVLGDDVTQAEAMAHADDVLRNAVGGISDIIHRDAQINVDFEDVRSVMTEPGKAMMGTAQAGGPDRAAKAADAAVACPLLEGIDLSGARGVLVLIAANKANLKLSESKTVMNTIRRYAADDAHIIYGAAYDDSLGDQLRVTVIATGLSAARRSQGSAPPVLTAVPAAVAAAPQGHTQSQPVAHRATGTDGPLPVLLNTVQMPAQGQQPDYAQLNTPSVWRGRGGAQAAARVEALTSSGMDEIEIPAFLRKQAD